MNVWAPATGCVLLIMLLEVEDVVSVGALSDPCPGVLVTGLSLDVMPDVPVVGFN